MGQISSERRLPAAPFTAIRMIIVDRDGPASSPRPANVTELGSAEK